MDGAVHSGLAKAVEVLKAAGAREVYVFGSCATGAMRDDSDVDLAVSGLPPRLFFKAMSQATAVLGREMDLIDLDEATPFTRQLKNEGRLRRVG